MQRFIYKNYGGPENLILENTEMPKPGPNEVLIQNMAIAINPSELHKLTGSFWLLRLSLGIFKPKKVLLGGDVAGIVIDKGHEVVSANEGDLVFGRDLFGCLSEFCSIDQSKIARVPKGITLKEASTLPLAAVTALIALRDKGQVRKNHNVLINGASGGIGTFAVQLAKYFGANVTGVTSTSNVDLVKSLGADAVIDYKLDDIQNQEKKFDVIIDLVGDRKVSVYSRLLRDYGRCVLVGMDRPGRLFANMLKGVFISKTSRKAIIPMDTSVNSSDLSYIAQLVENGSIRPIIDKTYDFVELPRAFKYLSSKRAKGKIVIELNKRNLK